VSFHRAITMGLVVDSSLDTVILPLPVLKIPPPTAPAARGVRPAGVIANVVLLRTMQSFRLWYFNAPKNYAVTTLTATSRSPTIQRFRPCWSGGRSINACIRIWREWQGMFWQFLLQDVQLKDSSVSRGEWQVGNVAD
jgi:hypothetical protein